MTTQNIAGATDNENSEMNGGLCPPNPRSCGEPVQHGHRVRPEPPAGKHIRRSPQTNLRQTINTSTQLPTSQTMQHSRHSRNSLRCEHKVAQSRCKHNQHRRGRGQEKHRHQHRHQPHRISASNDCSLCNEHRVAQSHRRQPAKHLASISKTMSTKSLKATVGNQHINHRQLERNINERVRRGHGSDYLEARQYSVGQRCCEGMHLQLPRGRHRPLCSGHRY